MRIRSPRTPEVTTPTGPPPRDSEALEHVVGALDAGVTGDADAHRRVVRALGEALALPYAAVWLPEPSGGFRLDSEFGRLAGKLARDPRSGATLPATSALVQRATATRVAGARTHRGAPPPPP